MIEYIENLLVSYGLSQSMVSYTSVIIAGMLIIFISALVYLLAKNILLRILRAFIEKSRTKLGEALLKNKVFERIIYIIPAFLIHFFAPVFPSFQVWIQRIAFSYMVLVLLAALSKLLDAADDVYRSFEVSKSRPIKGYLQVLKIIAYVIGTIVIIAVLIDRSPLLLLSGIGAATAVLMLIFQNSILGLVASIQLASNNMVQIGDWIEMPKYGADGDVIDISLHTVKVQNWDKTITTIPTHALIADSFKNWKGMSEAGGRRIKRSIYIDMTSIKFCDEEMLERFKKIRYIQQYINDKTEEIEEYNKRLGIDTDSLVNGRHLTNIGTFRAYIVQYLKNHPRIHKGMTQIVRQLEPTEKGLPIEIYAFTNDTAWAAYESIQSDIFDHILAVVPEFDLRLFQNPSGHDLRRLRETSGSSCG
ncbi:MAG: mechanosensitive ion channel family protein [Anaerovoracaceae bacterium]|jgi:miniconductance mechanosensitive channel|nr:mechanosensitive ion channel family protein [Clostridiales bacterium]HQC83158.1 mechanosensitive ion channel family protein [Bacillota bacterium]